MSDLAKAGLTQLVDVADNSSKAVLVGVDATKDAVNATIVAAVNIEGKTLDAAIDEAESLRQQYIASIRRIVDAVGDVLP